MNDTITLNGIPRAMNDIKSMQLVWNATLNPPRFMLQVVTFSEGALADMEATAENLLGFGLWMQVGNAQLLYSISQLQTTSLTATALRVKAPK